jgi:hypothetical protein
MRHDVMTLSLVVSIPDKGKMTSQDVQGGFYKYSSQLLSESDANVSLM